MTTRRAAIAALSIGWIVNAVDSGHGGEKPSTRPPSEITVLLPEKVSRKERIPLKLAFVNDGGHSYTITNAEPIFLLDQVGKQVKDPFYREAAARQVVLEGPAPEYSPDMVFNPHCKELAVGKRYQVVCIVGDLIGSAWVTLVD